MAQLERDNPGLYILLLSVHGLIRGREMELGRDADTGGQIKYVVELAQALIRHPDVDRVDLVTRAVKDANVSSDYARPLEEVEPGLNIVRVPCGPERYLRKELLWPHLDTLADEVLHYLQRIGRCPDVIHSHYADAGYVASRISGLLDVPMVHTGHSLGRVKRQRLLDQGLSAPEVEAQYNITKRIEAEETALDNAAFVVASTRQEIDEQYSTYNSYQPRRMTVIPPGVDLQRFYPPKRGWYRPAILAELERFLERPKKPMILALQRPDARKNLGTLIRAYAETPVLRDIANLVLIIGNRDDLRDMEDGPQEVINELFYLVDRYDLYGSVAYPKRHDPDDVPHLYRLAAKTNGVFVNPALTEPFGLTLLEAAASGLPIVATEDGGPRDIVAYCKNGLLIDPLNAKRMGAALLEMVSNRAQWSRYSRNGVSGAHKHFSWPAHATKYMRELRGLLKKQAKKRASITPSDQQPCLDRLVVCDVDNTLIGAQSGVDSLLNAIKSSDLKVGFGVATGRHIDSVLEALNEWNIPRPDVMITSVGTEIYYGPDVTPDEDWQNYISYRWRGDAVRKVMRELPGLELQPKVSQRRFKISYFVDPDVMPDIAEIVRHLRIRGLHAYVVYSHQAYLDVLPLRASKGDALRYLALKWNMSLANMLVAGDCGNDIEMLRGRTYGVVVGNHSPEVDVLRGEERIYFAEREYCHGVLEGIEHFSFLNPHNVSEVEARAS